MPTYLYIISTIGIILGLGHFYFGYIYHIKKTSVLVTTILLGVAVLLNFLLYKAVFTVSSPLFALGYFYMAVLFLFVFHHWYDTYRFGMKKQSLLWLAYGIGALFLTYSQSELRILGPLMIWSLVFYHYLYWIYLSTKKMESPRRKIFLKEVVVVHMLAFGFFVVEFTTQNAMLTAVYSLTAFHHLTSVHIIFSAIKEMSIVKFLLARLV